MQFDWTAFYRELAHKLLSFKDQRPQLVERVKGIYSDAGINMPTLEKDKQIVDIDPFTVFGLFNKSSMKVSNRIKLLSAIAERFKVKAALPTAFDSIPVLNNQNATFYYFVDERNDGDIDGLWRLFETALAYAANQGATEHEQLSKWFDFAINLKGNGNSKITMGLYWIAPEIFLNIDSRNEWYIYKSGKLPSDVVSSLPTVDTKIPAAKYFTIVEKLRAYLQSSSSKLKNFKELSFEAWTCSQAVNEEQKAAEKQAKRSGANAALADEDVDTVHYWIYSPGDGAAKWDEFYNAGIMGIGWEEIGDIMPYAGKEDIRKALTETLGGKTSYKNAAHALWQFAHEMKPGDIIFAKKGMHEIVGRGVVVSGYEYDNARPNYCSIRKIDWTHKGEWQHPGQAVMKTLTDITAFTDYIEKLNSLFEDEMVEDAEEQVVSYPMYDMARFLSDVYMGETEYERLVGLLKAKKNIILQGAPGVGKTFAAKRLAYSIMGVKDQKRVMMVQFHQSYSYEAFVMGFRPTANGFELKKGAFYTFCKNAEVDSENDYFFIIDEINRGNLSKIFGELFMLIEGDKRKAELQLLYSDEKFSIPENLYIIGMMNMADRSLAMLDFALRRRFGFFEMNPGFTSDGFRAYRMGLNSEKFNTLVACVESLNNAIAADESLGEGFCVGHSYLCNLTSDTVDDARLSGIVEFELIPLLKEYWFDEPQKVKDWSEKLRSVLK